MSVKAVRIYTCDHVAAFHNKLRPTLGQVFHNILAEKGIDEAALKERILKWVEKESSDLTLTAAVLKQDAETWYHRLMDIHLSWAKFCKGLEIIEVSEITILV